MKSIPNKVTAIKNNDGEKIAPATYADLIRIVINQDKEGGFTYMDIENRMAISAAIKDNPQEITLEDDKFNYLKKLIETAKWGFWHEALIQLRNDIMEVK